MLAINAPMTKQSYVHLNELLSRYTAIRDVSELIRMTDDGYVPTIRQTNKWTKMLCEYLARLGIRSWDGKTAHAYASSMI